MNKADLISKIHLIISIPIVVCAAIIYGFFPDLLLDIKPVAVDEHNLLKAIMLLYLGFSILWIYGLVSKTYFKVALISHMIFMLALATGRLLSMVLDGNPSDAYIYGTVGELILGLYGLWVMRTNPSK